MSRRRGFSIICSVVFGAFALGLAALAGNINLPQHNLVSRTSFEPSVATHQTQAASELALQFPSAREIAAGVGTLDRKSTRLNSSHLGISYAVFCLKKKKKR